MSNRHALVIGASTGIGAATARTLSLSGWDVTAIARRPQLLNVLSQENPRIRGIGGDVTDTDALDTLVRREGPFQAVVYAAGWNVPDRELTVLDTHTWRQLMSVNVDGAFTAVSAALPAMRAAGDGLIIFVSSISAVQPDASGAAYQASKRALHGLAGAINLEEGHHGIRACLVLPGLTRTDFNALRRNAPSEEQRATFLSPQDVASAIAFICELPPHVLVPELTVVPTANPWNR